MARTEFRSQESEASETRKADGGTVWSGLGRAKKAVKSVSVGFGRFSAGEKLALERHRQFSPSKKKGNGSSPAP